MKKTAVIIKGNPKLIEGNKNAEIFYDNLKSFLESLEFETSFNSGEPYTEPKKADLWIGHSRGADRLRFADSSIIVIGIGVPESTEEISFPIINHPEDLMVKRTFDNGVIIEGDDSVNDLKHYILTEEMKNKINQIIKERDQS